MTRNDLLLIAALAILSASPIFFATGRSNTATIKIDGAVVRTVDLTADATFTLKTPRGENVVEIKNGAAAVIAADCPDKICVKTGAIRAAGEIIACIPHGVLIEVLRNE